MVALFSASMEWFVLFYCPQLLLFTYTLMPLAPLAVVLSTPHAGGFTGSGHSIDHYWI